MVSYLDKYTFLEVQNERVLVTEAKYFEKLSLLKQIH
jgi:hypothetical protein